MDGSPVLVEGCKSILKVVVIIIPIRVEVVPTMQEAAKASKGNTAVINTMGFMEPT